ncbi:Lrp/AsnC family leucine-responsive transcriptional regulator [Rhizobium leguminosarum]|uniref:AsnC family protein n=1 Tax=Rhizobium leguminosarum TaxID=384 RepID=A0A2Z4YTY1_RHILE|nr:AsnC family protein [Rhizobium leguminosarum]MBA9036830.1 DNA-binding Lrp family transcriptional regulator [Rhizobium leguminosarum]
MQCLRLIRQSYKTVDRVVANLNPARPGRVLNAVVTVEVKAHGEQHMRRFLVLASSEDAVSRAYSVTGGADVVLFLHLRDMSEFETYDRLFREQSDVIRFVTMMVIRTAKEETAIAI